MVGGGQDANGDAGDLEVGLAGEMGVSFDLLAAWIVWERNEVGIRTCHFRHVGLKLGFPLAASSSLMKTKSVGMPSVAGLRAGRSLAGYVISGTASKSRWRGAGILGKSL